jgi:hypothetical protein
LKLLRRQLIPSIDARATLGKALDHIQQNHGEVTAVIPNIGLTRASLLFGTSFQGVKGFAIVYKKHKP